MTSDGHLEGHDPIIPSNNFFFDYFIFYKKFLKQKRVTHKKKQSFTRLCEGLFVLSQ